MDPQVSPNIRVLTVKDCFRKEKERWMVSKEHYAWTPTHRYASPSIWTKWPMLVAPQGLGTCCFKEVYSRDTLNSTCHNSHLGIVCLHAGKTWGRVQPRGLTALWDACCSVAPCLTLAFLSWSPLKALAMAYHFFHSQAKAICSLCSLSTCHHMC